MIFVKYLEDLEHSVTEFYNHREKDEGGVPEEYCFITQLKVPLALKVPPPWCHRLGEISIFSSSLAFLLCRRAVFCEGFHFQNR